jgi:hypothetical protein
VPSNVPPQIPALRIVGLDALDGAALALRRQLKGVDASGVEAVYHHALTVNIRGVDVHLSVSLRGPDCRAHVYSLDGPRSEDVMMPDGPTPEQILAAHVAVARQTYQKVTHTDVSTAALGELLHQRAALRGALGALLDAFDAVQR